MTHQGGVLAGCVICLPQVERSLMMACKVTDRSTDGPVDPPIVCRPLRTCGCNRPPSRGLLGAVLRRFFYFLMFSSTNTSKKLLCQVYLCVIPIFRFPCAGGKCFVPAHNTWTFHQLHAIIFMEAATLTRYSLRMCFVLFCPCRAQEVLQRG